MRYDCVRGGFGGAAALQLCQDQDALEEVPEEDELDDYSQLSLNSARRRVQVPQQACTRVWDFHALSELPRDI